MALRALRVMCSEELNRPENKDLKDVLKKLQVAKAAIDKTSAAASAALALLCSHHGL